VSHDAERAEALESFEAASKKLFPPPRGIEEAGSRGKVA
jgi:hypothetical protein